MLERFWLADATEGISPGDFVVAIFFFGTLSARLSSIFPCLLIAPLLLADNQCGELETSSRQFQLNTLVASGVALIVPSFGSNPIQMQILS